MPQITHERGQSTANEPQDDGTQGPQPPSRLEASVHGRGYPGQDDDLFDRKLTPERLKEAIARLQRLTEFNGDTIDSVEQLLLDRVLKVRKRHGRRHF